MLPDSVKCCPHCGSVDGYYYDEKVRYRQYKAFGNAPDGDGASENFHLHTSVSRCNECKRIIKD